MGQQVIDMMKQFATAFGDAKQKKSFDIFDVKELKKNASSYGKGVTYINAQKLKREDREGYKVVYKFNDINEVAIDQSPDSHTPMKSVGTDVQGKEGRNFTHFSFKKGNVADLTIIIEKGKDKKEDTPLREDKGDSELKQDSATAEMNQQALAFIKGMRLAMSVQVNGEIVETDASYREKSVLTLLELDFGKFIDNADKLKDLEKLKSADLETVKLALKKMPGAKVELNEKVNVKFK